MKSTLIFCFISSVTFATLFAQPGEVTNAILAHKDGVLADAKTSIDKACEHEKTKDEPKTWYYKGKIYESLASDPILGKQYPDAAKTSFEAYKKAKQLDETAAKPNKYKKDLEEVFASPSLSNALQNGGVFAYQSKDYTKAYEYFTMFQEVNPKDTLGYIYAAQMALAKDDYKSAKETYQRLVEKTGYVTTDVLNNQLYIYKNVESERDYNKALEVAKTGRAKFPNNPTFVVQETDLLEKTGKLPEAIANAEAALAKEPKAETYLLLGSLYEKTKELEKAKDAYNKALSINPNSFEANFNLGALLYNPAVDIIKTVRNMSLNDYQKKGKQMESQAKEVLKLSQPYFEKAYQIKPDDESAKKTLKDIYSNTGQTDKANALK